MIFIIINSLLPVPGVVLVLVEELVSVLLLVEPSPARARLFSLVTRPKVDVF